MQLAKDIILTNTNANLHRLILEAIYYIHKGKHYVGKLKI